MPKPRIPTSGLDVYFSKQPSASGDLHALHQEDLPPKQTASSMYHAPAIPSLRPPSDARGRYHGEVEAQGAGSYIRAVVGSVDPRRGLNRRYSRSL